MSFRVEPAANRAVNELPVVTRPFGRFWPSVSRRASESRRESVSVGVRSGPPGTSQQSSATKNERPAERHVPRGFSL